MFFHFVLFFSLEKTITKLDLLQFDTLFSFADLKQAGSSPKPTPNKSQPKPKPTQDQP